MIFLTAFSDAVKECAGLMKLWIAGADIRKMKACINAGEFYIHISEDNVILPETKKKLLLYYKKVFFKYN